MSSSLSTLMKLNSNAIVFVINNKLRGLEQWLINPKVFHDEKEPLEEYLKVREWDYGLHAESFGSDAYVVMNNGDLSLLLKKLEVSDTLAVVDVVIPQRNLPEQAKWRIPEESSSHCGLF
jgi:thiamine pyrophosphate-dependent acetolactate synthase large subunit-like protein